jgi:hypothetical protein
MMGCGLEILILQARQALAWTDPPSSGGFYFRAEVVMGCLGYHDSKYMLADEREA